MAEPQRQICEPESKHNRWTAELRPADPQVETGGRWRVFSAGYKARVLAAADP